MTDDAHDCDPLDRTDANYPATVRFTLATATDAFDVALDDAAAAERGDESPDEAIRAFDSLASLRELLTERRIEVLRSVHEAPPPSISALADRLDRQYAVVHDDVHTLARHGVVVLEDGPRGAKRPVVPYDAIRVDVPLVGFDASNPVDRNGVRSG